jgi:hypothetical protein
LFATVALQEKKEFVAMKRALAGVLVAAVLGCLAGGAVAEPVPYFQVYFDDASNGSFGETSANCGQVGHPVYLYVVARNFESWLSAVEFKVDFPDGIMYVGETIAPPTQGTILSIGNSNIGLTVSTSLPRNGFGEPGVLITTIFAIWTGDCYCQLGPSPIVVGPYPYPDPGKTHPSGVRWPDLVEIPAVGMTSLLCPGVVPTQESTWGGIKALYR